MSALFVLIAACAIVSALLAPVVRTVVAGDVGVTETIVSSLGGALVAMALGAVIGLYHYRPWRGLAWGVLTGGLIGLLVGPISLAPASSFGSLIVMSLGGAAVLLVTAAALGLSVKKDQ